VTEWVRLWKVVTGSILLSWPIFTTFELYAADGAPSLDWMSDNWNWHSIPKQFQDASNWGVEKIRYCDDHDYMNLHYGAKRLILRPAHTMYFVSILAFL